MGLINFYSKIFNPNIEEALFFIECSYGVNFVTTNPIQSDVERSILHQLLFDNTLSKISNSFTMLLKNLNPSPENMFAYTDCNDIYESDAANLCESDYMRGPNNPPKKSTIQYQPSLNQDTKHYDEPCVKSFKEYGTDQDER